ncbi:hypothetical protein [Streptomyces sp. NPDC093223]|uniref:hypothetical protein n=1 Tax=Streptomyces sp. NPDC093223 TaxID=3366033 RepID=UPI003826876B
MIDIEMADPDDYAHMADPTNTYGLLDNCYYCVAAFLSGRTVEELIVKSEQMQYAGGAQPAEFAYLLQLAGLHAGVTQCVDANSTLVALGANAGHFGTHFVRHDNTAHVVVAISDGQGNVTWYDPQINSSDTNSIWFQDAVAYGREFYLWGPH